MTLSADQASWERLGRLLAGRREEIGARYRNKTLFAAERGLNKRMVWRLESGNGRNYGDGTVRDAEDAYMLERGSLARALAGGDLEPLPAVQAPPVPRPSPTSAQALFPEPAGDLAAEAFPDDPVRRRILRLAFPPVSESPEVVATLFRALNDQRREDARRRQEGGDAATGT